MSARTHPFFLLGATVVAVACSATALAKDYPTRPITLVVAYPAGGDTDQMARMYAEKLRQRLGQTVVVENRSGASGVIGSSYVARAKPDGYTLLVAPSSFAFATHVVKTGSVSGYHPVNDFESIIQTVYQPLMLVANKQSGYTDIQQLLKDARANKALSFSSPGPGSNMHVLGEMFNHAAKIKLSHVPYKGVAPAVQDVMGGHVPLTWMSYGPVEPYVKNGEMKVLLIASDERTELAPDAPSMKDIGISGANVESWQGILAPKGTPRAIVDKLNATMREIVQEQDVREKMRLYGAFPRFGTPEDLTKLVAHEYELFGKVIEDIGIKFE